METLWQVLRMYDVILRDIKIIHVNVIYFKVYVRIKGSFSEFFRTDRGVRQGCIMSPWLFNVYMDTMMKEAKMGMGRI